MKLLYGYQLRRTTISPPPKHSHHRKHEHERRNDTDSTDRYATIYPPTPSFQGERAKEVTLIVIFWVVSRCVFAWFWGVF